MFYFCTYIIYILSVTSVPKVINIIVSKNNKVVSQVSVKNLKEIPAYLAALRPRYPNHRIGIEAKDGKIVYREGTCGYGIDGELGDEPAGPQLLKKKSKTEQVIKAKKKTLV